ncbi:Uncharacterised protein [Klebsiella oxytoca]|nr:Uncharacterised protein [Klebsiella oxytoca]
MLVIGMGNSDTHRFNSQTCWKTFFPLNNVIGKIRHDHTIVNEWTGESPDNVLLADLLWKVSHVMTPKINILHNSLFTK